MTPRSDQPWTRPLQNWKRYSIASEAYHPIALFPLAYHRDHCLLIPGKYFLDFVSFGHLTPEVMLSSSHPVIVSPLQFPFRKFPLFATFSLFSMTVPSASHIRINVVSFNLLAPIADPVLCKCTQTAMYLIHTSSQRNVTMHIFWNLSMNQPPTTLRTRCLPYTS
jgi:hypothetical protein